MHQWNTIAPALNSFNTFWDQIKFCNPWKMFKELNWIEFFNITIQAYSNSVNQVTGNEVAPLFLRCPFIENF